MMNETRRNCHPHCLIPELHISQGETISEIKSSQKCNESFIEIVVFMQTGLNIAGMQKLRLGMEVQD